MTNRNINSSISINNDSTVNDGNFQLVSDYYNHFDILNQGSIEHIKKYFEQKDNLRKSSENNLNRLSENNEKSVSINSISFLVKVTFILIILFVLFDFINNWSNK